MNPVSPGQGPGNEHQDEVDPVRPDIAKAIDEDQQPREESQGHRQGDDEPGGGEQEDEGEEFRKPKVGRIPTAPTKRELAEHLPLHVPYKAWCPICVAGEGIHNQARKSTESKEDKLGVTISMDYCFLTTEGEAETDPKVLVMHDDRLDAVWALSVKAKGPSPEIVT